LRQAGPVAMRGCWQRGRAGVAAEAVAVEESVEPGWVGCNETM